MGALKKSFLNVWGRVLMDKALYLRNSYRATVILLSRCKCLNSLTADTRNSPSLCTFRSSVKREYIVQFRVRYDRCSEEVKTHFLQA